MNIILDTVSLRNCPLIIQMHNILYTIIIITWKLNKKLHNTFIIKMKRGIRATRLSEEISSIDGQSYYYYIFIYIIFKCIYYYVIIFKYIIKYLNILLYIYYYYIL